MGLRHWLRLQMKRTRVGAHCGVMLHHLSIAVSNLQLSGAFYDAALGALGYELPSDRWQLAALLAELVRHLLCHE